jgi:hypothetical protein
MTKWYRKLGYRSSHSFVLMAGAQVFLLIDKALERKLGSWEGLLVIGITISLVAIAISDYVDWRKETRAGHSV